MDIHEEQSNIWGPKIDRMKISEYKIIANIRRSFCTIQNEVHFTPDFAVRTNKDTSNVGIILKDPYDFRYVAFQNCTDVHHC